MYLNLRSRAYLDFSLGKQPEEEIKNERESNFLSIPIKTFEFRGGTMWPFVLAALTIQI